METCGWHPVLTPRRVKHALSPTVPAAAPCHAYGLPTLKNAMSPGKRPLSNDATAAGRRRRLMAGQAAGGSTSVPYGSPSGSQAADNGTTNGEAPGAGRKFSDSDVDAIVTAFLCAQTRNGRTLTDADVELVAGVVCKRLEEGALSAERIKQNLVEPVAEAASTSVDEAVSAYEARHPNTADLAKMVSGPVVEAVKKTIPAPSKPLKYTEMSKPQLRAAIKELVPPSVLRQAEHAIIKQRVLALASSPSARGDVLTQLAPPTAHGSKNNTYVWANGYRITLGVMQYILSASHASGDPPEVFREWTQVAADDRSQRHSCFVGFARGGRHDVRADGRVSLYKLIIYFLMLKLREGVYIKLLSPNANKPEVEAASGHAYYSFETSMVVCEGGIFLDDGEQRTAVKVVRGCLIQRARTVFYEFVKDKDFPFPVLAAVAETMRIMIQDVDFDWHAKTLPDHVGSLTSGPRAWRLLLPRADTRTRVNQELEAATNAEMDLLDDLDEEAVDAAALSAESAFGLEEEDFGILPM